jgi:hypothetical protein
MPTINVIIRSQCVASSYLSKIFQEHHRSKSLQLFCEVNTISLNKKHLLGAHYLPYAIIRTFHMFMEHSCHPGCQIHTWDSVKISSEANKDGSMEWHELPILSLFSAFRINKTIFYSQTNLSLNEKC